jgi:TolB protein
LNKTTRVIVHATLAIAASIPPLAQAQLRVEISGVGSNQIPIAVAAFADEPVATERISAIIKADLAHSGIFNVIDTGAVADTSHIAYGAYTAKGADALVVGAVARLADGRYDVRYQLLDTVKQDRLSQLDQAPAPQFTRLSAHKIADDVYFKLTGIRGIFSTRIAFVRQQGRGYQLVVADADGEGEQLALRSNEPIISPSWSPDGARVAYVSFELQKPVVYVHNLVTGQRRIVANEKGSNSAPAWAPDGSKLAVALSRDNHYQIYVVNADGGNLRRVSNSAGFDTEPQWSPDGKSLYFTSDRSGEPQIYRMAAGGGDASRITFSGSHNTSPRLSPDGKTLAYISRRDGNYQLYAMDLASGQEQRLSDGSDDQYPSFAPNGKYILYATQAGGRESLAVVSVDGRVKQRLTTQAGNIKEPAWGPFLP